MSSGIEMGTLRSHGGILDSELSRFGMDAGDVLDFSVNVNPYGPTPSMLDAIRSAPIDRYPDPTSSTARRALAESIDVSPDAIVVGNGAVDLMWTIARAFVSSGASGATPVLIVEPTFSEFRAAVTLAGAAISEWRAHVADRFAIDIASLDAAIAKADARVVYLCSPGNPTGTAIPIASVAALANRHERALFVVDQSFLSLSENHSDAACTLPSNVIRLRSLTKDHAIPGLRAGYLIGTESIAARIEAARPPWTTSAPAQAAIIASARESAFVAESRNRLLANRVRLASRLVAMGMNVLPSSTVYLLFEVANATALRARLLVRERILVRDCTSFALPHYVRVCARPEADEDRLLRALEKEARA